MERFTLYSKGTMGGGATVKSTSSGGGSTRTTTAGGGTSKSTQSGGGTSQTSSGGGNHRHTVFRYEGDAEGIGTTRRHYEPYGAGTFLVLESSQAGDLVTEGASGTHNHSVSVPSHSHNFSTPDHSHNVTIPTHTHEIELPDHTHDVKHGIYELSEMPSSVQIRVDGVLVSDYSEAEMTDMKAEYELLQENNTLFRNSLDRYAELMYYLESNPYNPSLLDEKKEIEQKSINTGGLSKEGLERLVFLENAFNSSNVGISGDRINLQDYLEKDSNGRITRGRHEITIHPNGLARIEADLILRAFIRSHIGKTL